jgi:hypothetical protein
MSARDNQTRIEMLERTVLELGAELFQMKSTVNKSEQSHEQFLALLKGLKRLLDDKGLITLDDFEAAVELGAAIEQFSSQQEHAVHSELEKLKKTGH